MAAMADTGEQLADETASSVPLKIAPIPDGYRAAESDGVKTVSNFEKDEDNNKDEAKVAAGKKGGKASAEKREAEAKAKPEPSPKEEQAEEPVEAAAGSDDEAEESDSRKPLGKPDRDPRARVAEATREARQAREEARAAREEVNRIRWEREQEQRQRAQPQQEQQPQRDTSKRPELADFEDYGEYTEALTDWKVENKFKAIHEEQEVRSGVERMAKGVQDGMDKFRSTLEAADAEDQDWGERVDERLWSAIKPTWMVPANEPIRGHNVLFDELTMSEMAPALLLYFSDESGQRDFSRIARLRSPREIAREMAKLEERLRPATAGTRPESSVSKAPLPFQPVKGAPHTGERVPGPDASYEEHKAYWNAKDRKSASR